MPNKSQSEQHNKELGDLRRPRNYRKRHLSYRIIILTTFLIILGGGWSLWKKIQPTQHFTNLKTISHRKTNYHQASGSFNALIIGSDERRSQTSGHTDSMMLVHANLAKHRYTVLSIPRDLRIYMPNLGYTKLTSVQSVYQDKYGSKKGITMAVKTISNYLDVPINYYLETNYWGLRSMIDAIGGITINLPFKVRLTHPWYSKDYNKTFSQGKHQLSGKMITEIVHERDSVPGTDFGRQRLQEAALIGIVNKVTNPINALKIPALAKSMSKFLIGTNLKTTDMISIGLAVKGNFDAQKQVRYLQLSGENEVLYDNILENYNEEIVLNRKQLKKIIVKDFEK
ncbi:LCP family protein [Liquorilactobacillus sicerae]|uniref:LCP family protein n=1 Tax=Liquorilactobacillus sicerae TaxID=1416943 RepID=UPI002480BF4E|nr:LCP family protein [Liquorilactobacillus sicerae]